MLATRFKRFLGFLIDVLVLGIVGYISGFLFEHFYIAIGGYGKIIGFLISMVYFSVFDSKLFNGQTIGKKIVKIKVVNQQNETITIGNSIFRSLFYSLTILLNGISFPNFKYLPVIIIIGIILFSLFVLEAWLFIFNRSTGQTLHDLLSKTYVVDSSNTQVIDKTNNNKVFRLVIIIPIVISVLVVGSNLYIKKTNFNDMLYLVDVIQNQLSVRNTTINKSVTKYYGTNDSAESNYILINCYKTNQNESSDELSLMIADIIINSNLVYKESESLIIVVNSGFDIGIAQKNKYVKFNKPFSVWKEELGK